MDMLFKIKQLANQKGITISELERRINLSNGQIGKWSRQTPGIDKVKKVADFFDVSVDYLVDDKPKENYGTMFRMNTDGFSEEDTKELMDELEKYQSMYRLMILERKKGK